MSATELETIEVLNGSGHLTLTWNPADPKDVEKARREVEDLKKAGYTFFAVVGAEGSDEIEAGNGMLIVERVDDPVPTKPKLKVVSSKSKPRKKVPGKRTVAVRQMSGG